MTLFNYFLHGEKLRLINKDLYKGLFTLILIFTSHLIFAQDYLAPEELRIKPNGNEYRFLPYQNPVMLNDVTQGELLDVFICPPCLKGDYFFGIQLSYDMKDHLNTEDDWSVELVLEFLMNNNVLWEKPLSISETEQIYQASVFDHGTIVAPESDTDDDYQVRIKQINTIGTVPLDHIELNLRLFKTDEESFDPEQTFVVSNNLNGEYFNISWNDTQEVTWEYDVEWVYIAAHENFTGTTAADAFAFKEPTRISTTFRHYDILNYYPADEGSRLWARVRAIGVNPEYPEHRINGYWNYGPEISITNHQPDINWQVTTSFAENGKYKKVMQYFDGSLRARQTSTNLNSEDFSLIAESKYDFEGRKSIDILPVPDANPGLGFREGFNNFVAVDPTVESITNTGALRFHYDNFRMENSVLSDATGTGAYYSPNNSMDVMYRNYIPDAQGYAYAQTSYIPDNSGRIRKQSGPGEVFKTDDGRVTKYFYGEASTSELVRLFGRNVGNASHYKKNAVVDPNKQVSISYVDQEGRVVATALAGEKPETVEALESYDAIEPEEITHDITEKNKKQNGVSWTSHNILNTSAGVRYTFNYDLSAEASTVEVFGCQSCTYDLQISIIDPDGYPIDMSDVPDNEPGNTDFFVKKNITAYCDVPYTGNTVTIEKTFEDIGTYTIIKELVPHELSFEELVNVVSSTEEFQTTEELIRNAHVVNTEDCEICTDCDDVESLIEETIDEVSRANCENIRNQIIKELTDQHYLDNPDDEEAYEPTEGEISNHELYCKYGNCMINIPSATEEIRLAMVDNWIEAENIGYDHFEDIDPFFIKWNGLSGDGYKDALVSKLNNIDLGTVPYYNSEDDDLPAGSTHFSGPILEVIDYTNPDYYIDHLGKPTGSTEQGFHLLYYGLYEDLQEGRITAAEYQTQLDANKWQLYKGYYLQAKLQVKKESISIYQTCLPLAEELETGNIDNYPQTPDVVRTWAEANGLDNEVTEDQLDYTIGLMEMECDIDLTETQRSTIEENLIEYFSSNEDNFFKLILTVDLGQNSSLAQIETILVSYGCTLERIAEENPLTCSDSRNFTELIEYTNNEASDNTPTSLNSVDAINDNTLSELKALIESEKLRIIEELADTPDNTELISKSSRSSILAVTAEELPLPSPEEYNALKKISELMTGNYAGWSTANWEIIEPVGDWYGVGVDENGHITSLYLMSLGYHLAGILPDEIGDLTYLNKLVLSHNDLTGRIPATITNLINLDELDLGFNDFTGIIPQNIESLPNLTKLIISDNESLTGPIPPGIYELTKLTQLDLSNNDLYGNIPPDIVKLINLTILDLSDNSLGGSIPSDIDKLTELTLLDLSYNFTIEGNIPPNIVNLSKLKFLSLGANNLTGTIPSDIDKLSNLIDLLLGGNGISGSIPTTIGNLNKLENLELYGTDLSGSIPETITNLEALQTLWLNYTPLTGSIPDDIGKLRNLTKLYLRYCRLFGPIPESITNLKKLEYLDLHLNSLTGSIPNDIGNLENLYSLDLANNQLSGVFPASAKNLTKLYKLLIDINKISGDIPTELSQFANLSELSLSQNQFTFSNLIDLKDFQGSIFGYSSQELVDEEKTYTVQSGKDLIIEIMIDRNLDPLSKYQWFKLVGTNSIPLNNPCENENCYKLFIENADESDEGIYYYTITNEALPKLTLRSNYITINLIEGDPEIIACLGYDLNNPALLNWQYNLDLEAERQKCVASLEREYEYMIDYALEKVIREQASTFINEYNTNCLDNTTESLSYSFEPKEHHYTLYYYDQAGNLIQTVPPKGVQPLSAEQTENFASMPVNPDHTLITKYHYNSLNQLVWQQSPDAGQTNFWYDDNGQLRVSQNAQQFLDNKYSYTKYDNLGRIIEVGELLLEDASDLTTLVEDQVWPYEDMLLNDITRTYYDLPSEEIIHDFTQENLRNRVSWVGVYETSPEDLDIATYYSYDIHGNVKAIFQQLPSLQKRIDYVYDLISGNVNFVMYQFFDDDQEEDLFIHKYTYDADNRIQKVRTSTDGFVWNTEATYYYYAHGPLARIELGEYAVQGIDYYYTLQGWIKGVNMPHEGDPGDDGSITTLTGKDEFAYSLGYYDGDYVPVDGSIITADARDGMWNSFDNTMTGQGLYNGNISWMVTDLPEAGRQANNANASMQAMLYKYDQLHRIIQARSLTSYTPGSGFGSRTTEPAPYDVDYSYDPNGNLLTLQRNDEAGNLKDDYNYHYFAGTNRLKQVTDHITELELGESIVYNTDPLIPEDTRYKHILVNGNARVPNGHTAILEASEDIILGPNFTVEEGGEFTAQINSDPYTGPDPEGNYVYDAIGNLIEDKDEGITISWTPYGKVRQVTREDGTYVAYKYDASGNRVEKVVETGDEAFITEYVRDASGNVIAVYNDSDEENYIDFHIYGSSRIGQYKGTKQPGTLKVGLRQYELTNHLGNVLAVINDKPEATAEGVTANVLSTNDYYPFGLTMAGRTFSSEDYRYGFNGKEKDASFGETSYDYGFRIYNPRIAKFLSVDPLTASYPWYTPYQFAGNMPIWAVDLDGLEPQQKTLNKLEYRPVIDAPNAYQAVENSAHNAIVFLPNLGISIWNHSAEAYNFGMKVIFDNENVDISGMDIGDAIQENIEKHAKYASEHPVDYVINSVTDLECWEDAAELIIAERAFRSILSKDKFKGSGKIPKVENAIKSEVSLTGFTDDYIQFTVENPIDDIEFIGSITSKGSHARVHLSIMPKSVLNGERELIEAFAELNGKFKAETIDVYSQMKAQLRSKGYKTAEFYGTRETGSKIGSVQSSGIINLE